MPAVAVEADPRMADPVTVAACEDVLFTHTHTNKTYFHKRGFAQRHPPLKFIQYHQIE